MGFPRKILFNLDPSKQAIDYPSLLSHDTKIQVANNQKHLGFNLDSKLGFNEHRDLMNIETTKWTNATKL